VIFKILGRSLSLTGTMDASLEAALRSRWDFPEYTRADHPFKLEISCSETPPTVFPTDVTASVLELPSGNLECRHLEPIIWLGDARSGARLSLLGPRLQQGTDVAAWGLQAKDADVLHIAIAEGLRASGLISLHASIATRDGQAIAFLGPSGRGKTTTLLRALAAGFQPVCEDFAWCDPDSLEVFGFDRGLRLLPDTAKHFEAQFGIAPSIWQVDKWFVPYSSLNLQRQATTRPLTVLRTVALLERDPERPTGFEPLSKREAALAFWEASGMPLSRQIQERVSKRISSMVSRLEGRRLRLGQGEIPFDQVFEG
jgi:hypothetical protein